MPSASSDSSRPERLPLTEYVGYALGDTASNLFFQTFNIFLTYYYVDVWGLAAASVGQMMLLVRFSDAVADPVIEVGPGWTSGLPYVREDPPGSGPLVALWAGVEALREMGERNVL